MKKTVKRILLIGLLAMAAMGVVACGEHQEQSSVPKTLETLESPTNVDFSIHLSQTDDYIRKTSYHLSWSPVQHATGYKIYISETSIERTVDDGVIEYDITTDIFFNKNNTITVTALGDGVDYQNSQTVSLQGFAGLPTMGLEYKQIMNCYMVSRGEVEIEDSLIIPDVYNGKRVTVIDEGGFRDCKKLISVMLPDSVMTIREGAFASCSNLISAPLPNGMINIEGYAFQGTGLTNVTIPNTVESIGESAFSLCKNLTSVTIGENSTGMGKSVFSSCINLTDVMIMDGVTNIAAYTFYGCSNLKSLIIPDSVSNISTDAFGDCESLTSVYYKGTAEQWNSIIIEGDLENVPPTYYYSAEEPALNADGTVYDGNFWRYDENGEIVVWIKE